MDKMTEPAKQPNAGRQCPVCGTELPPQLAPNRCPRCLLRAGLEPQPPPALGATVVVSPSPLLAATAPQPGETFGHYRISRLLGEGGMGAVFEAEDLECGRRVALKVLGHRLDSPEARNRFFREGRLAASVNHPNSVYVYGTEEIAGIPVIAMELVAGGTLQKRVSSTGPLPVGEAVDSVLQIVAGLESAQRVGVLHRDVKPSNCFVEADGTVKIGDFGLSISTLLRTEPSLTATGSFLGTPAFSSPEQLRGDELTVRSDIYAVGVTLYYLLTGRHPFAGGNMVQLLATVLERRPDSPAKWRPRLPQELCRAVLRCLEKDPDRRFRNYDELRAALLPYSSTAPTPATLGWRFVASCLDALLLSLPQQLASFLIFGSLDAMMNPENYRQPKFVLVMLCNLTVLLAYYGLLEGLWGASAGKAVCGLRVARLDRTPPGVPRAALRALIFQALPNLPALMSWCFGQPPKPGSLGGWPLMFLTLAPAALMALVFSTARRRNGFAAWHDLASGTRVIVKAAYHARPTLSSADEVLPNTAAAPLIGPYHVLDKIGSAEGVEVFLGFDARLLRRVWIRRAAPGACPVPPALRQVGRAGRLRWLNGQRTATEAWDVYEAAPGKPLLSLLSQRQCWSHVRYWLLDLIEELKAAGNDGSLPAVLDLDRVWITAEGRAKLLDFPAPGAKGAATLPYSDSAAPPVAPTVFVRQVALSALAGRAVGVEEARAGSLEAPLALHARRYLDAIKAESDLADLAAGLRPLLLCRAVVSRARRLAMLGGGLAFPLLCVAIGGVGFTLQARFLQKNPELAVLRECLVHHAGLERRIKAGDGRQARERDALETYIAGRFAQVITNRDIWSQFLPRTVIYDQLRLEAERTIASKPPPSKEAVAEAEAIVTRLFRKSPDEAARQSVQQVKPLTVAWAVGYFNGLILVVIPGLLASLLFRGGALSFVLGIAFVNRDGARSSRGRVAWRNLVAWLPFVLFPLHLTLPTAVAGPGAAVLLVAGFGAALALISTLLPQRGLQDRLAGTWPVPR
jgi:hypothetical protein